MKELQSLLSPVRKAVEKYKMIEENDLVCVEVSGGKDSLAMLCALAAYRDFGIVSFELKAIMIDIGFSSSNAVSSPQSDVTQLEELCARLKVPFCIEKTEIAAIVFDERKEKNPCSLCANMRRGALLSLTEKEGGNKLSLGHHMQDVAETVIMNLIHEGRFGCFSPVTMLEDRNISIIRPMIMCDEMKIKSFVRKASLPVIESGCPIDRISERAKMREILDQLDRNERGVFERIENALCKNETDGW